VATFGGNWTTQHAPPNHPPYCNTLRASCARRTERSNRRSHQPNWTVSANSIANGMQGSIAPLPSISLYRMARVDATLVYATTGAAVDQRARKTPIWQFSIGPAEAAVLPHDPHGMAACLQEAGLVQNQDTGWIAEMLTHIIPANVHCDALHAVSWANRFEPNAEEFDKAVCQSVNLLRLKMMIAIQLGRVKNTNSVATRYRITWRRLGIKSGGGLERGANCGCAGRPAA
jgi:hypothetical protein